MKYIFSIQDRRIEAAALPELLGLFGNPSLSPNASQCSSDEVGLNASRVRVVANREDAGV